MVKKCRQSHVTQICTNIDLEIYIFIFKKKDIFTQDWLIQETGITVTGTV